jgi:hypothetical protein
VQVFGPVLYSHLLKLASEEADDRTADHVSLFSCGVGTRLLTARFLQKGSHYVENCQKEDIAPS